MIDELLREDKVDISVLPTNDKWIGITYKKDLEPAKAEFKKMLDKGQYPKDIWNE